MNIISGKEIADEIKNHLNKANRSEGIVPCLAVVVVGDNKESLLYVGLKESAVKSIGGRTRLIPLPNSASREEVLEELYKLNLDREVDGILLQLPLPPALQPFQEEFLEAIDPQKDVDGFSPHSRGRLMGEEPLFISCGALACMDICKRHQEQLAGKKVLLVGDSFDIIQPLALMFIKEGSALTVVPQYDSSLMADTDLAIIERGKPLMVKETGVREGTLIIDAGFYWHQERMCGNVDREALAGLKGNLLAVPGGLGPILIAKLMENLCRAARS